MSFRTTVTEDLKMWRVPVGADTGAVSLIGRVLYALIMYPGFACVFAYRLNRKLARFSRLLAALMAVWRHYTFQNDISYNASIGPGFMIGHTSDIVIGKGVTVGARCIVYNGVTLGAKNFDALHEKPTIGDDVIIGTGSKVLGRLRVGNGARIGALTLCLNDVPDGATAVGIPARILDQSR